ncbi:hypothetical protein PU33_09760 [Escherichia coli]|nr:hypothetical protein PU33_09760 [Escherichia coli]
MNPVPWLQMTNMISYQGLVRTFLSLSALNLFSYTIGLGKISGVGDRVSSVLVECLISGY